MPRQALHGPMSSPVGEMWGDYLIVRPLSEGGMGSVYMALQMPIALEAALKILHADVDGVLAAKFRGEASALARVRHPNVVRLMHYGVHRETPFLVMEHVEGGRTLAELAKRPPPPEVLHHVIAQAARGLGAAHRRGIVHRDIKLANVMLQATDEADSYFVRIVDFGLAKFTDGGHHTQHVAGTIIYMAPEQFRRDGIGPWSDVYALGQVALRIATGKAPYAALSHREIAAAKLKPDHDPAAGVALPDYPEAMLTVLRRAFAADPAARYEDGYAFAQAWDEAFGVQRSGRVPTLSTPIEAVDLDSVSTHLSILRRRSIWPLVGLLTATVVGVGLGMVLTAPSPETTQTPERLQLQRPALPVVMAIAQTRPDATPQLEHQSGTRTEHPEAQRIPGTARRRELDESTSDNGQR